MKTILQCRAERLKSQADCPQCSSSIREQYWSAEVFPGENSDDDYLPSPDDQASLRFECGAEFAIDEDGYIISRSACSLAGTTAASLMESEADEAFEHQEDAA